MADETLSIIFTVEDGTCVSGANSYISLEEANQYQTNKGRSDWLALTDEEKLTSLIKGTQYVDALYTWKGRRKYQSQELSFPRVMLRDRDGFIVDGIPKAIRQAVCEAAFYGYQAELFTTHSENGQIKRQKVDGAVEVEYFNASEGTEDFISKYAALDSLLKGLYFEKGAYADINAIAGWDY